MFMFYDEELTLALPHVFVCVWATGNRQIMVHTWLELRQGGRLSFSLLDRDRPAAWVIDRPRRRAVYTGRVAMGVYDIHSYLLEEVMRRTTVDFDLPPDHMLRLGPGRGTAPPPMPSTSMEEDPSETSSQTSAPSAPPGFTSAQPGRAGTSSTHRLDPTCLPSTSRGPVTGPASGSELPPHSFYAAYLVRVRDIISEVEEVDVETGAMWIEERVTRREIIDVDAEVLVEEDSRESMDWSDMVSL